MSPEFIISAEVIIPTSFILWVVDTPSGVVEVRFKSCWAVPKITALSSGLIATNPASDNEFDTAYWKLSSPEECGFLSKLMLICFLLLPVIFKS